MTIVTDDEAREGRRRRQESMIMSVDAGIILLAAASFIIWAIWGTARPWAWMIIAALLAGANIYAQRTIRVLRVHNRELLERCR